MQAMVNIALRAARSAAEALIQTSDRLDRIRVIDSDPSNFVSSADEEAESTIIYHLHKAFPQHSIRTRLGENIEGTAGEPTWLVDPLVGSLNFSRGIDPYGIVIACEIEGSVAHSVLLIPALNEEFTASRGTGAQLNNRRIRVSAEKKAEYPMFALDAEINSAQLSAFISTLNINSASFRMSGCCAIDMANTAAGRFSGGWCINRGSIWQTAVKLLLTEAGSLLGTEDGNPDISASSELIFAGPKVFKTLVKLRQSVAQ